MLCEGMQVKAYLCGDVLYIESVAYSAWRLSRTHRCSVGDEQVSDDQHES